MSVVCHILTYNRHCPLWRSVSKKLWYMDYELKEDYFPVHVSFYSLTVPQ